MGTFHRFVDSSKTFNFQRKKNKKKTKKNMTTILDIELPSQEEFEEDPSFNPTEITDITENQENDSQDANEIEENSSIEDADQIPVGKVEFPLNKEIKGVKTGEAFIFESEDQKVTNINELDCNDTLDEDDHVYANEEEVQKEVEGQIEECDDDSCDSEEIDEENDEDLNNIEKAETLKCCRNLENEEDKLVKMKFKDVEELKRMKKNLEKTENEEEEEADASMDLGETEDVSMEDSSMPETKTAEKESTASTCQTDNCPKEGHNSNYKEEEDTDYNPIYDDTLSDVEEPEDMDNEEDVDLKAPVEVIYTNDQFCMIKDDNLMKIGADSREEMECC